MSMMTTNEIIPDEMKDFVFVINLKTLSKPMFIKDLFSCVNILLFSHFKCMCHIQRNYVKCISEGHLKKKLQSIRKTSSFVTDVVNMRVENIMMFKTDLFRDSICYWIN